MAAELVPNRAATRQHDAHWCGSEFLVDDDSLLEEGHDGRRRASSSQLRARSGGHRFTRSSSLRVEGAISSFRVMKGLHVKSSSLLLETALERVKAVVFDCR